MKSVLKCLCKSFLFSSGDGICHGDVRVHVFLKLCFWSQQKTSGSYFYFGEEWRDSCSTSCWDKSLRLPWKRQKIWWENSLWRTKLISGSWNAPMERFVFCCPQNFNLTKFALKYFKKEKLCCKEVFSFTNDVTCYLLFVGSGNTGTGAKRRRTKSRNNTHEQFVIQVSWTILASLVLSQCLFVWNQVFVI